MKVLSLAPREKKTEEIYIINISFYSAEMGSEKERKRERARDTWKKWKINMGNL